MQNVFRTFWQRCLGDDAVRQCTFMHSAARLVQCMTLHSDLSVPIGPLSGRNRTLGVHKAELTATWRPTKTIKLDHVSMISAELLYRTEFRARQVKGHESVP